MDYNQKEYILNKSEFNNAILNSPFRKDFIEKYGDSHCAYDPRNDFDSSVRLGFVIADPSLRGKGYGKEMRLVNEDFRKKVNVPKF